ncbi:hypothetical protein M3202_21570 [Alkalihalobacillus oceani]|uniref:Uncharacterized protein n=1 Tax=Halalkalibacter oceani TaxID=1653776 RepID=A0A9X2DWE6_9BACI|nr:hypothetical protein [Halalkalibacter oceani]MCM3716635.1 hypothetical protein [Halalkalibacter oceani]
MNTYEIVICRPEVNYIDRLNIKGKHECDAVFRLLDKMLEKSKYLADLKKEYYNDNQIDSLLYELKRDFLIFIDIVPLPLPDNVIPFRKIT